MKVGPKSFLRPFLHRALQLLIIQLKYFYLLSLTVNLVYNRVWKQVNQAVQQVHT